MASYPDTKTSKKQQPVFMQEVTRGDIDIKPHELRYRILDPATIAEGSMRRKKITCGVSIVTGCAKGKFQTKKNKCMESTKVQALRFDRMIFTPATAAKWINKHWRNE